MRVLALPAAVAGLFLMSGAAAAADGFYVAPSLGITTVQDRDFDVFGIKGQLVLDQGYSAALAVGYRMGDFRFELDGAYNQVELDAIEFDQTLFPGARDDRGENIDVWTGFLSAYYDLPLADLTIKPYIGGGVGVSYTDIGNIEGFSDNDEVKLALQGEVGFTFNVTPTIQLAPNYRFIWVDDEESGNNGKIDRSMAHNFRLTARISF